MALFLALGFTPEGMAQESIQNTSNNEKTSPDVIPSVTVKSARRSDFADRQESIIGRLTVSREDLERYKDSRLIDVLRRVPTLSVTSNNEVRMRGLGAGYIQILIDGRPAGENFSLDAIAPNVIEKIEVLTTPSAEYGARAVAGTINIVLKKNARRVQPSYTAGVSSEAGHLSETLSFQIADKIDDFSYNINVSGENRKNQFDFKQSEQEASQVGSTLAQQGTIRSLNKARPLNISLQGEWSVSEKTLLSAQLFGSTTRNRNHTWQQSEVYLDNALRYPDNEYVNDGRAETFRGELKASHRFDSTNKLDIALSGTSNRKHSSGLFTGLNEYNKFTLERDLTSKLSEHGTILSADYEHTVSATQIIKMGAAVDDGKRSESRTQRDQTFDGAEPINLDQAYTAQVRRFATYAQNESKLNKNLSAYVGVRWERIATRAGTDGGTDTASNTSSVVSPIVQFSWKQKEEGGDQARLGISRTYKSPTTESLIPRRYYSVNNSPLRADTQGNPELRPELSTNIDFSYERYFENSALLSASIYAKRIHDVILTDLSLVDGSWIEVQRNQGKAVARGISADFSFPLKNFVPTSIPITFKGNFSRNWSHVDAVPGPNNYLNEQTPKTGSVSVDYGTDKDMFSAGTTLSAQAGTWARTSQNQINSQRASRRLDLYGALRLSRSAKLQLSIFNVLRHDVETEQIYFDPLQRNTLIMSPKQRTGVRLTLEGTL